jgi:hypothetical protein
MPVTGYSKVDMNDHEKLIPLSQTAAGISPAKLRIDDGDIAAQIKQLEISAGVPAAQRHSGFIDKQDWERTLIAVQNMVNKRTATVSIATPAVATLAAHGWQIGQAIQWTTTGALPTGITAGTTYYIIATGFGAGAFQFSATKGGAAVNTSGTQSGVHSLSAV